MNTMQFVIQPLPGTDEQFNDRLREVSEKIHKYGFGSHRTFEQLKKPVKELVIGPTHIGVLLEDGKVFRVAFSINCERLDLSKAEANKSSSNGPGTSGNSKSAGSSTSSRPMARSRARLMRTSGRTSSGGQGSGSRSSGVIIGGSSTNRALVTTVPATYVPEELISQAEVVLQGKSRNLIIRELQRTNLDVNLAVNNLLSRDDEDAEDTEDGGDNYVPEDLISLLDNGFHGDNNSVIIDPSDGLFSEEIFSNYSSIRNLLFDRIRSERNQSNANNDNQARTPTSSNSVLNGNSLSSQISSVSSDREAFSRWRDRQYYGPRRWLNKDDCPWDKETEIKKKESLCSSPIWISEELQAWSDKNDFKFRKIAALYSELIALSENGELHQWKWSDLEPFKSEGETTVHHPKTNTLSINEKVILLSANFIRCSIVTENNRVATWMDEQLGYLGSKLEHPAVIFSEFFLDPIISVDVCSLYSLVRTENNNIYWWGVLPFEQRRCLWEKFRTKTKKPFKAASPDITVGTSVVMKKCPIYQTGSIGFTFSNGIPKVGQLLNSVWDFNDICRFKILNVTSTNSEKSQLSAAAVTTPIDKELSKSNIITNANSQNVSNVKSSSIKETTDRIDMPPPPSPASSTCSDTGSVTSHKRVKRIATKDENDNKKDEELWHLKDVVFVEDKIGPIGKVLKVDGDFVAVRFPVTSVATVGNEIKDDDWQQCRLLRRDDIQIYKTAMTSRGPDWIQKNPKKINIIPANETSFQLLALSVDNRGIHVIKKLGSKLHYCLYNLYNSKQEQNSVFPTDSFSFIGASSNNITMVCNNECSVSNSTIILRDGNCALYPISKDCIGSIKDPQWFDLPPVKSVTMSTISLNSTLGSNQKSMVCFAALLFENQLLMPHILRSDIKNVFTVLNRLEKDDNNDVSGIIQERCDGCRNIFHTATVMCAPSTNKETDEKKIFTTTQLRTSNNPSSYISTFCTGNIPSAGENLANTNNLSSGTSFGNVPTNMTATSSREGRSVSLREMMMNSIINNFSEQSNTNNSNSSDTIEDHIYVPSWPIENNASTINDAVVGGTEDEFSKVIPPGNNILNKLTPIYTLDPMQRREHAIVILQHMSVSPSFHPYLQQMLTAKDAQGQTPFMLSICSRAYEAGIILLNTILMISENDNTLKELMIFPPGSPADQSPLHVICYNDTCSFTWTGADHINQNIFECKTCGLTGSLCCCTECARVCHKGHDCKLKRTSPTAYCDCWEKCKCKALIAGNQNKRFQLLCKLSSCTDLVTKFNSKGESILLFLIQTVGRQIIEQRQYRANSRVRNATGTGSSTNNPQSRKSSSIDLDVDMPEHDLEPPKFARKALEHLLNDWQAVRAMIMTGSEKCDSFTSQTTNMFDCSNSSDNYNFFVQSQHGSTLLDKFTHNLFVKCTGDHLETLLNTLVREIQNDTTEGRKLEAEEVARRFVRSVTRVFVIFNLEKVPNPEKRKSSLTSNKHIQSCLKVFHSLQKISIEELCDVAEALITPVRLGVVRPTAPFAMSSSNNDNSDELFSVEPLAPTFTSEVVNETNEQATSHAQVGEFNLQNNYSVEGGDGIRDTSETDDGANIETNIGVQDEEILGVARNEEGTQDDESDNDFPFNDAETESDSDDNQSNHDAQRSVQTGATMGSETDIGVLFLEDESGDSSPQDEEASEDGETDDHSDEFSFNDQQLERRGTNSSTRNDLTPHSMQWAIRTRDASRSSVRVPTGSSLVFIDPVALRRSTVPASTTVAPPPQEQHTMISTASNLSRGFSIILRQISELLNIISNDIGTLKLSETEISDLFNYVEKRLKATWNWMFSVMDSTEAQLKFGAYLTNYTDPTHPLHPLNLSSQNNSNHANSSSVGINILGASSRRDFFTYCLSLMRAHTSEHRDALPVLDVSALRHIAYVLDGFIFYLRNDAHFYDRIEQNVLGGTYNNDFEDTDEELSSMEDTLSDLGTNITPTNTFSIARRHSFFSRSDSTLSLGSLAQEGYELPLDVSIPLADKPHLLQPTSKRQDLFANLPLLIPKGESFETGVQNILAHPPTKLGFSTYENLDRKNEMNSDIDINGKDTKSTISTVNNDTNIGAESSEDIYKQDGSLQNRTTEMLMVSRPEVIIAPTNNKRSMDTENSLTKSNSDASTRSVIVRACSSNVQLTDSKFEDNVNKTLPNSSRNCEDPKMIVARGQFFFKSANVDLPSWNLLLGRWKLTLDLFGRVFLDDVGMENGSVLPELRGFPVKEIRFRRHMEKLRNGQQRDLILCKLERNRENLIIQTFKELNTQFGNQNRRVHPPLAFNRVKVTFKDEPGEGSGVARSFYTSISEALLATLKMPNLESVQVGNNSKLGVPFSSILRNRGTSARDLPALQRRGTGSKILWRAARERKTLNYEARPYLPSSTTNDNTSENSNDHLSVHLQQLGDRLYPKINSIHPEHAPKITGMLLEIPAPQLLSILTSEDTLRQKVNEALEIITFKQKIDSNNSSSQSKKIIPVVLVDHCQIEDNEPLFYSPGKRGFYTPRQGYGTYERINAFRNIGRLIGLCLLQNELLPLFLQRHVLKYILGRKIKFHDLAFFDPIIYESLRQLIQNTQSENSHDVFSRMELYFAIDLRKEEGGGSVELIPGGREIQVTPSNIFEYIKRYTEYRLIKSQEKALEALKDGVFDVLPDNCMTNLTAEDFRLLLNGVGDINVTTLISYTAFNDESSEGPDKLLKFKRWFWSIVEKMNTLERQDLVYFWTGSPALPASEEGFQPLPSVTIRPADDTHLPTANTCISRLYIPLYSSKSILRSKLLLAIKSKNFGFV